MIYWFRKRKLLKKWRKKRKHKQTIRLHISDVLGFLKKIEQHNIRYLILRWFEEVPPDLQAEQSTTEDADLLIDMDDSLDIIAELAARQPGQFCCDLYSPTGRRGGSYLGSPYYPPIIAEQILNSRIRHPRGFYIPDPETYFHSLAYHLVYHKGLKSGIESGCPHKSITNPKRNYASLLQEIASQANIPLPEKLTLLSLHEMLNEKLWAMPYDLIERWPVKSPWHEFLLQYEQDKLAPAAEQLPELIIFFVRDSLISHGEEKLIYEMLREKFRILMLHELTAPQVNSVIRQTRGGNWLLYKSTKMDNPVKVVFCYDDNPVPIDENDHERRRLYPLVTNENVFHKHTIRKHITEKLGLDKMAYGIHSSDNKYGAIHMLQAVFGPQWAQIHQQLIEKARR